VGGGRLAHDHLGIVSEGIAAYAWHARCRGHPAYVAEKALAGIDGILRTGPPRSLGATVRRRDDEQHGDPGADAGGYAKAKGNIALGAGTAIDRDEQMGKQVGITSGWKHAHRNASGSPRH